MYVTTSDFKTKISYYLSIVKNEDIIVTKNGNKIARIITEEDDPVESAKTLFGILPSTINKDEIIAERIKQYDSNDLIKT